MFNQFNSSGYLRDNKELHKLKGYESDTEDVSALDNNMICSSDEYKKMIHMEEGNSNPDGLIILTSTLLDFSDEDLPVRFINNEHRMRVAELLARAGISVSQPGITSVFYIIGGSSYLYNNVEFLFSFLSHTLTADVLFNGFIPADTQEWKLYALALALADEGYVTKLYDLFEGLSEERLDIAVQAVKMRFTPMCFMEE